MARAPRSIVPRSSGQGISRLGYQKAYSLGPRIPSVASPSAGAIVGSIPLQGPGAASGIRDYPAGGSSTDTGSDINVGTALAKPAKASASFAPAAGKSMFAKQMPRQRLPRG
jgi:hypothetical protein